MSAKVVGMWPYVNVFWISFRGFLGSVAACCLLFWEVKKSTYPWHPFLQALWSWRPWHPCEGLWKARVPSSWVLHLGVEPGPWGAWLSCSRWPCGPCPARLWGAVCHLLCTERVSVRALRVLSLGASCCMNSRWVSYLFWHSLICYKTKVCKIFLLYFSRKWICRLSHAFSHSSWMCFPW